MSDRPVRWGVLGVARIAKSDVIPAITAAEGAEALAVASRDAERARHCAEQFEIPRPYGSYEALLSDPDIEAVYIPLPNHLHAETTIAAARAGKHVLCEKPMAATADDARRMFDASDRAGVHLMEAFMYRFHPQTRRVLELLAAGTIGPPRLVRSSHSFPMHLQDRDDDFRWQEDADGGCLGDLGIYCLDVAQRVFDAPPTEAWARAEHRPPHSAEAALQGIVSFGTDRALVFDCSFLDARQSEYAVTGERGRITAAMTFHPGRGQDVQILIESEGDFRLENIPAADEYRLEVEHFSRCVRSGTPPEISRHQTLRNLTAADGLRRAAAAGERIRLDL